MIVYRIKQKNIDLYVKGTPYYTSYDNFGRLFSTLGKVRTFITHSLKIPRRRDEALNWEIISYRLEVDKVAQVHEIIKPEKIVEMLKQ